MIVVGCAGKCGRSATVFESAPPWRCWECEMDRDIATRKVREHLRTLASNLAVGAGLCEAFVSGRAYQMAEDIDPATKQWRPGHVIDTLRAAMEKP